MQAVSRRTGTGKRPDYPGYVRRSVGTLGGGNHFIEVDLDDGGCAWLVVHSGSRNFGSRVAEHHQEIARRAARGAPRSPAGPNVAKRRPTPHPNRAWKTEKARQRAGYAVLKIGLNRDRTELYARINQRVEIMVEQGILQEVEHLLAMGYARELNPMQSIGYKHMINYIDKIWQWDEALACLARDTRRYAKRQLTWFGRDEEIRWFRPDDSEAVRSIINEFVRH